MIDLSPQEEYIIKILRERRPHERIEIIKDQSGKPNTYLIHRSQKVVVNEVAIIEIK